MNIKILTIISLLPFVSSADEINCPYPTYTDKEVVKLSSLNTNIKEKELKDLALESNDKVKNYHTEYSSMTCNSVTYKFPEEQLFPGEISYFHIPNELRERGVNFVIMGHRQNPDGSNEDWDESPGLSSFQLLAKDKSWNYWNGMSSGNSGAKFAENRMEPEMENLYDWNKLGHTNIKTSKSSNDSLPPQAAKVLSMGKDPILLSEITIKVDPLKETSSTETIYTKGTSFSINAHDKKYTLGGGQAFKGKFPDAKELDWREELSIPLEAGKEITSINIACGDSMPDEAKNKDGGWGTSGWAKISIGIQEGSGSITWLTKNENVPPGGMIIASPKECGKKIKPNSKVIIKSNGSTLYIMGTHVGYK